jgi:hypothetical protein
MPEEEERELHENLLAPYLYILCTDKGAEINTLFYTTFHMGEI